MDMGRSVDALKKQHFDDIRVYFDTKLIVPKCTHTGLAYVVQFDVTPLKVSLCLEIFDFLINMKNVSKNKNQTFVFSSVCALGEHQEVDLWIPGLPVL